MRSGSPAKTRLWPSCPGLAPPGFDCSRCSLRSVEGGLDDVRDVLPGRCSFSTSSISSSLLRRLASGARFCEQVMLLSALEDPSQAAQLSCKRIGGPLLLGRLWEGLGIADVLRERRAPRAFEFALERAVFVAPLHRLFVSGSDRDCASWMQDYAILGSESLSLHHFYRAMAWLGEELPEKRQDHATPFSPRTIKDEIEEALFARHQDLFTDLSVVFMDTTSLSFEGAGGETLGAYGFSKDHRPDLKQMILAVVVDGEGRPICTEMMPGNTADVSVLVPVIDRLRHRFGITRACVVADRGMISEATIAALDERGLEYVLGAGFTHQTYLSLKTGPQSALRSLTGLVLRWLSQGIGGAGRLRNHPQHRTADPYA